MSVRGDEGSAPVVLYNDEVCANTPDGPVLAVLPEDRRLVSVKAERSVSILLLIDEVCGCKLDGVGLVILPEERRSVLIEADEDSARLEVPADDEDCASQCDVDSTVVGGASWLLVDLPVDGRIELRRYSKFVATLEGVEVNGSEEVNAGTDCVPRGLKCPECCPGDDWLPWNGDVLA